MHHDRFNTHRDALQPRLVSLSKQLARLLRHEGQRSGLKFTQDGWCQLQEILRHRDFCNWRQEDVEEVVQESLSKGRPRFQIQTDDRRAVWVRATAKHSYSAFTPECRGFGAPPSSANGFGGPPPSSANGFGGPLPIPKQPSPPYVSPCTGHNMQDVPKSSAPFVGQTMPSSSSRALPPQSAASSNGTDPLWKNGCDPWSQGGVNGSRKEAFDRDSPAHGKLGDTSRNSNDEGLWHGKYSDANRQNNLEVQRLADDHGLDADCRKALQEAPSDVQRIVLQERLQDKRNPNAFVMDILRRHRMGTLREGTVSEKAPGARRQGPISDPCQDVKRQEQASSRKILSGTMNHYGSPDGKFGFIREDDEGADPYLFVVPMMCAEGRLPPPGTRVLYIINKDVRKGSWRADQVRVDENSNKKGVVIRPGEWICENCQEVQFAGRDACHKCKIAKAPSIGDWCCVKCSKVMQVFHENCTSCGTSKYYEESAPSQPTFASTGLHRPSPNLHESASMGQDAAFKGSSSSSSQVSKPKPQAPILNSPKPPAPKLSRPAATVPESASLPPPLPMVPKPTAPILENTSIPKATPPQTPEQVPKQPKAPPPTLTKEEQEAKKRAPTLSSPPPRRESNPEIFKFEDEEEPEQVHDDTSPAIDTASTTASSAGAEIQVTSNISRKWSQFTDPNTHTAYWWHDDANWFREDKPEKWVQYTDPNESGRSRTYWFNHETEEWFYTTVLRY